MFMSVFIMTPTINTILETAVTPFQEGRISQKEAMETVRVRAKEQGEECYFKKIEEGRYIVYRKRDNKVMKSVNYFRPNLKKFFND